MFDLTSEKCTTLTGLYQFKNEETNKSNFQECENKRVSHVSIRTRRGVVVSVLCAFCQSAAAWRKSSGSSSTQNNKQKRTNTVSFFFCCFCFFYSAWGEGVTGFMKGDWSHGCTAADSSGKDVSAVMWRSLLLTMTVIPLSGLDGL